MPTSVFYNCLVHIVTTIGRHVDASLNLLKIMLLIRLQLVLLLHGLGLRGNASKLYLVTIDSSNLRYVYLLPITRKCVLLHVSQLTNQGILLLLRLVLLLKEEGCVRLLSLLVRTSGRWVLDHVTSLW